MQRRHRSQGEKLTNPTTLFENSVREERGVIRTPHSSLSHSQVSYSSLCFFFSSSSSSFTFFFSNHRVTLRGDSTMAIGEAYKVCCFFSSLYFVGLCKCFLDAFLIFLLSFADSNAATVPLSPLSLFVITLW